MKLSHLFLAFGLLAAAMTAGAQQVKPYHQNMAKDCSVCHTQENAVSGNVFVAPSNQTCLTCHESYAAVAAKTQKLENGEPNPHASAHYGEGIACTACHSEHKPSQVYCNNCHEFKYNIH